MRNRILLLVFTFIILNAQAFYPGYDSIGGDSVKTKKVEKIKKGLNFGVLPILGYSTDLGLLYGAAVSMYNYGDGTIYPDYKYMLYVEYSRSTKGQGTNQIFFDSKGLIKGVRITSDISYLTELKLDFYGFNGYDAIYHRGFAEKDNPDYISSVFYNYQRKFLRVTADGDGNILRRKLRWHLGLGYYKFDIKTVDIERINKGKKDEDILEETDLLYDKYIDWGIIREEEKDGGDMPYLKLGLTFDTRDNENNPMQGFWDEVMLMVTPKLFPGQQSSFSRLSVIHRQYISLIKDRFVFAYRLAYQGTIGGKTPFYLEPYMITAVSFVTTIDGLGGSKTLRGILRNRVVGDGVVYGNAEFRYTFLKTVIWNQNVFLSANAFADAGRVVQDYNVPDTFDGQPYPENYFDFGVEKMHLSYGGGINFIMNRNFIISTDFGFTTDKRDGDFGFYAGIGYLF
jgi:hypothetical protein